MTDYQHRELTGNATGASDGDVSACSQHSFGAA
jgi:hypothetical protein